MKKYLFVLLIFLLNPVYGFSQGADLLPTAGLDENTRNSFINLEEANLNLAEMVEQRLTEGSVASAPWSDSYWPIYLGGIGRRYNDPNFPDSTNWQENYNYINSNPVSNYVDQRRAEQLSPAEKYDLLVGKVGNGLTETLWQRGQKYHDESGSVLSWLGYCDGWAAASHFGVPEPQKPVLMPARDGSVILFYQSDIKALTSLLWSKRKSTRIKMAGSRCYDGELRRDSNGRLLAPRCFDINPMLWHSIVIDQVGRKQKSFVFDKDNGSAVWNFVVKRYSFDFFNVSAKEPTPTEDLNEAIVGIESLLDDPYTQYRNADTAYVVGIKMEVVFPGATEPHSGTHGILEEKITLVYDLELDADLNIVGGEWHSKDHPDFVWTFADGASIWRFVLEQPLDEWQEDHPIPDNWNATIEEYIKYDSPMAEVVERLLLKSQK